MAPLIMPRSIEDVLGFKQVAAVKRRMKGIAKLCLALFFTASNFELQMAITDVLAVPGLRLGPGRPVCEQTLRGHHEFY